MMDILTKALWVTLTAYLVFILSKWIYKRFIKPDDEKFMYFLSLKKETEAWILRVEAPQDEFEVNISIIKDDLPVYTKNAHLKAGINKIVLIPVEMNSENSSLVLQSNEQKLERPFIEAEV